MARNLAPNTGGNDHALEDNSAGFVGKCLEEKLQDRNSGQGVEQAIEVLHAKEHGDGVEPGGDETDCHSAHDGDGNHLFGSGNLFGHVGSAIQAGKSPIGIDQTNDESDAVRFPAGVVDKVGKDELGILVCRGPGRDDDQNDKEGHQRGVQGGCRNAR